MPVSGGGNRRLNRGVDPAAAAPDLHGLPCPSTLRHYGKSPSAALTDDYLPYDYSPFFPIIFMGL
jgi:hypothetical protein